jgi:uncharacterized DUF497 family protein
MRMIASIDGDPPKRKAQKCESRELACGLDPELIINAIVFTLWWENRLRVVVVVVGSVVLG